ncbi:MAG: lamin tail domain-containing protein [Bacteroidetes bacterium]|nr:lamin tail domain-containing protein [Bacteroidota bacterium]
MRQRLLVVLTVAVVTLGEFATRSPAQISAFPYVQNFDSVQTPSLPTGWSSTQNRTPGTNDFLTVSSNPTNSPPNAVQSGNSTSVEQSFVSPLFNFAGLLPQSMGFYVRRTGAHMAVMLVEASIDSGVTYSISLSDSLRNPGNTNYIPILLDLPVQLAAHSAVRFRWRILPAAGAATVTLRIDDVTINARTPDDLHLSAVRFVPQFPVEGDSVIASAKIINVGQESAQNFSAEFYIDANNDSIPQPSELRATVLSTSVLAVSDSIDLNANLGVFAAGSHVVIVKVVYPPDQNLSNNQRIGILNVGYPVRSVVINEIMYAPTSPEPEWVELMNTRADSVSLKNWMVADSSRVFRLIASQDVKIAPGGFAVLTGNPASFITIHPNILAPIVGVTGFPSLNNGGDAVMLYDNRGFAMDSVRYTPAWGGSTGGRSLERIDPLGPSTSQSNWGSSQSAGRSTPGERNSVSRKDRDLAADSLWTIPMQPLVGNAVHVAVRIQNIGRETVPAFSVSLFEDANADSIPQPGELVSTLMHSAPLAPLYSALVQFSLGIVLADKFLIARIDYAADEDTSNNIIFGKILPGYPTGSVRINEIMYVPTGTEPEWIELFNTRPDSINLKGWLVSDNIVTSKRVITEHNVMLFPNNYVVLARDSAALLDIHPGIPVRVVHVASLPTLNNSGDAVIVYDNRTVMMDSVAYLSAWGGSNGTSLERIDPLGSSTAQTNWGSSRNPARSTPGFRNSLARKDHDLALDSVRTTPPLPLAGDTLSIFAPVRNPGHETAQAFSIHLYKDENADSLGQPDELLSTVVRSFPLPPLDSTLVVFAVESIPAGNHLFIVRLEFASDEDTSNNTRYMRRIVGYPAGAVRINEIMYAPSSGVPEWIELVSTRSDTIDIGKWFLGNRSSTSRYEISPTSLFLLPDEYLVVSKDTALFRAAYPSAGQRIVQTSSLPTFLWNNSGDAVVLADSRKIIMDSVFYSSTWGGTGGKSLERLDALDAANDSTNWATSVDSLGATPGRRNSQVRFDHDLRAVRIESDTASPGSNVNLRIIVRNVGKNPSAQFSLLLFDDVDGDSVGSSAELFHQLTVSQQLDSRDSLTVPVLWSRPASGVHRVIAEIVYVPDERVSNNTAFALVRVGYAERTLVINEIMYAPLSGEAEYVEFYNSSQHAVDVAQWRIVDRPTGSSSRNEFTLSVNSKFVRPGEYFVLASDSSITRRLLTGTEQRPLVIVNQSSLSLNNDGDDIVLMDASGFVIDSVSYLPSWHNPNVTDKSGRSLEKINPLLSSNDSRNWSTCAEAGGGTPGRTNSVFATTLPARSNLSFFPNPFSPDGDGREDFCIIQYEVPLTVSTIRVRIYDALGRRIRTLVNNEPGAARGSVVWDGMDDDKQKARVGIYVVLLEAIDDKGGVVETAKGAVVLAARL